MEFISHNQKQTAEYVSDIIPKICGGDVLCLFGDLGSGKTTTVKAIAKYLGIKEEITSPTFVIEKQYNLPKIINGIAKIVHVDAYRLSGIKEIESAGILENINQSDALTIIEWPENILQFLPNRTKKIYFKHLGDNKRAIKIEL